MAHVGENGNAQKVKVRKPKGMRQLGSTKHTQDNIKMDPKEGGWHDADWIHVGGLVEGSCEHSNNLHYMGNFLTR
jgi:hypothetical protein